MADRFAGQINIGGKIPAELKDNLAELIFAEVTYLGTGCSEEIGAVEAVYKQFDSAASMNLPVRFSDDQARYGEFPDLEAFLRKHNIHFDRQSDARYEYDGETVIFRGDKEWTFNSTQNGELLVSYDKIREALEIVSAGDLAKCLNAIQEIAPDYPVLEPLEFVE